MKILLVLILFYLLVSAVLLIWQLKGGTRLRDAWKPALLWLPFLVMCFFGGFHPC